MKLGKILVTLTIVSLLLSSCSNGLLKDPRLYNPKKQTTMEVAPEPELELTGGADPFDDTEQWYNKPDTNGDSSNPDAVGFEASEFDTIQITGWFSDQNVPTYTMTKGTVWTPGDTAKHEYIHANAPNTEGQGWSITNVSYYRYKGINPNYDAVGNYNTALQATTDGNPKLSRFYFYRFTGKGGGVQALDNYLIAVDTYSKLVFAFSEPVEFSSMGAPTKWDPTDNEAFYGQMYQFYMYDPVGYVLKHDDGTYEINLYKWFQDSLASGNYKANINTAFGEIARKNPDGAGKSPFNNHSVDFFEENMKLFAGKTFKVREQLPNGGNGLKLYEYSISADGKQLTKRTTVWNGLESAPADVIYTIGEGEAASKGTISGGNGDITWLEIKNEGRELHLSNGVIATTTFQDYGPQFLERIKNNPHYSKGEDSYQFTTGNPHTLVMNGETYTYAGSSSDNNQTIYKKAILGVDWFYGVELSNSDYTVKMTSASAYGAILWGTLGWEANLKREKKENFSDNVLNSSFHFRPNDDTGNGLYLYTWEFSEEGTKVTLKKTPWNKVSESTSVTGVSVSNGNAGGLDGSANGISFTLSEDLTTLTISGCSDANGNGTFSRIFTDPGPSFLNRVKGAIYNRGNTRYEFSSDGRTLSLSYEKLVWESWLPGYKVVTKSYSYDDGSDEDNVIATYGGYRVQLTENDMVIQMATVANVGDLSVMEYEADRQN